LHYAFSQMNPLFLYNFLRFILITNSQASLSPKLFFWTSSNKMICKYFTSLRYATSSSSSMALQPGVGFHPEGFLVGKCGFCSEWPAHWPLDPDETARAIWQAVRRLGWEMAAWILLTDTTSSIHAVNLRHGTDGFTSPPKEVVLRIFITLKNPSPSVGIENREPRVQWQAR
jgi:hypothetical protein